MSYLDILEILDAVISSDIKNLDNKHTSRQNLRAFYQGKILTLREIKAFIEILKDIEDPAYLKDILDRLRAHEVDIRELFQPTALEVFQ
ncbi:MAG: hypothetical protein KAW12_10110 [Candidatus Aminicenantes bacterium]|nr:hypothetical protein [Candidatus Aminicenantes bacterium]